MRDNSAHARSTRPPVKAYFGMASGVVLIGTAGIAALWLHPPNAPSEIALTALIGTMGIAVGWLIGFLASPYGDDEEKRFSKYAATVSAFLSGYVLSKIEPTVTSILGGDNLLTKPLWGVRLLFFLICVIGASISMYVFRLYTDADEPARLAMRSRRLRHARRTRIGATLPAGSEITHPTTNKGAAD